MLYMTAYGWVDLYIDVLSIHVLSKYHTVTLKGKIQPWNSTHSYLGKIAS